MVLEYQIEESIKESITKNPYNIIREYAETRLIKVGRKVYSYLCLQPVSLVAPDIPVDEEKTRANMHFLILGPPSSGKCVTGDTLIFNPSDGSMKTIKEVVEAKDYTISAMDTNLKIKPQKPSEYLYQGRKNVIKVKTSSGREIKVTPEHPFFTTNGWTKCEDLLIGEHIAIPRILNYTPKHQLEDYKIKFLAYILTDGAFSKNNRTNHSPKLAFYNTDNMLLSDFEDSVLKFGNIKINKYKKSNVYSYQVTNKKRLCSLHKKLVSLPDFDGIHCQCGCGDITNTAKQTNKKLRILKGSHNKYIAGHNLKTKDTFTRPIQNNASLWLNSIGIFDKNSYNIFVPSIIFHSTLDNIKLFLNRIFACEGWVSGNSIGVSSQSKQFIYQMQHLLLRCGIISRVREKKGRYKGEPYISHIISIYGFENIQNFYNNIGILSKDDKIKIWIENNKPHTIKSCADTIPNIRPFIKNELLNKGMEYTALGKEFQYKQPKRFWSYLNRDGGVSRGRLEQISIFLNNERLNNLSTSDIQWDPIVEKEYLGEEDVYDLVVPDTHNFVANDIIVHNTSCIRMMRDFAPNPYLFQDITTAKLAQDLIGKDKVSLLCTDVDTIFKDMELIKLIEGIIGEEHMIQRFNMRSSASFDTDATFLGCGVFESLRENIRHGFLQRTVPIVLFHTKEEKALIGQSIKDGMFSNRQKISFMDIKWYYNQIVEIQKNHNENFPKIDNYHVDKKVMDELYRTWLELMDKNHFPEDQYLTREFNSLIKYMCVSSMFNLFNREIVKKDNQRLIVPNRHDIELAKSLFNNEMSVKYNIMTLSNMASNMKRENAIKFYEYVRDNDNIAYEFKQIGKIFAEQKIEKKIRE